MDYIGNKQVHYDDIATMINDNYDGFLAMVDSTSNNNLLS